MANDLLYSEKLRWKELTVSEPSRVMCALDLTPALDGDIGDDSVRDVYPALLALVDFSTDNLEGTSSVWTELVRRGVSEALCKVVLQISPALDTIIGQAPLGLSSFYFPSKILLTAASSFKDPPTSEDKRVMSTLKKYWSPMIRKLWESPENTLIPDGQHSFERQIIAQTLTCMLAADPAILISVYSADDMTIPLISRHWAHATRLGDSHHCAAALVQLFMPTFRRHIAYARTLKSPPTIFFFKTILLGASPPSLTTHEQCKAIIEPFASQFNLYRDGGNAEELLTLLTVMYRESRDKLLELPRTIMQSQVLWHSLITLLRSLHVNDVSDFQGGKDGVKCLPYIVSFAVSVVTDAYDEAETDFEPLLTTLAEEGLFDIMDDIMRSVVDPPGMTMNLAQFYGVLMHGTLRSPSVRGLLRSQMPRSRSVAILIQHANDKQQAVGAAAEAALLRRLPPMSPENPTWNYGAWQMLDNLRRTCRDARLCERRGCDANGKQKCSACVAVSYCGRECQRLDWKEHKLVCHSMETLKEYRRKEDDGVR